MGGSGPPSNTWFPRHTQVLNPNGSSIGAAVFTELTSVTDLQTDRPTDRPTDHATRSVRIGRIYVRGTAMRPNNFSHGFIVTYSLMELSSWRVEVLSLYRPTAFEMMIHVQVIFSVWRYCTRCDIAVSSIWYICPMDVCCLLLCFIVLLFSLIAAVYNKWWIKLNIKLGALSLFWERELGPI